MNKCKILLPVHPQWCEKIFNGEKTIEVRERIEKMFGDIPCIELFARQQADGWDCWGDEV